MNPKFGYVPALQSIKIMLQLGDIHNFGQSVCLLDNGKVYKPRNLVWENLLLDKTSAFRKILLECEEEGLHLNFSSLFPSLTFETDRDWLNMGGEVQRLELKPCPIDLQNEELACKVGAMTAFLCWLGIADLHRQNMIFGISSQEVIFAPLDIEAMFHDFILPSQTLLLPSIQCPSNKCGLSILSDEFLKIEKPNFVSALCKGYYLTLVFLNQFSKKIEESIFCDSRIYDVSVRLFIRSTAEYKSLLDKLNAGFKIGEFDLIDEEKEQLLRNEIPYFFRFFGNDSIYYFKTKNKHKKIKIEKEAKLNILNAPRIPCNDSFPKRKIDTLLKGGLLQLAQYFLPSWIGKTDYDYNDFLIYAESDMIGLSYKDNLRIKCARKKLPN